MRMSSVEGGLAENLGAEGKEKQSRLWTGLPVYTVVEQDGVYKRRPGPQGWWAASQGFY